MGTTTVDTVMISNLQTEQARALQQWVRSTAGELSLGASAGSEQESRPVPTELEALLLQVIRTVGEGGSVRLQQLPAELTTTAAAEIVGVSRPTLMKLIRENEIPAHKVGSHTRLKSADVLAFADARKAAERERRRAALDELRAAEDALD